MKREAFFYPPGQIYLDGNSLGLMPLAAQRRLRERTEQWAELAVSGWDEWFGLAESLSPFIARLLGAKPEEVIATGSITANLHSLLATFYRPQGQRCHLLATDLDFPSDLYALRSWAERAGAQLRLIPSRDGRTLQVGDILDALTPDVALALLPTALYRSGQLLPARELSEAAARRGIVLGWDAAHTVGAVPHAFHEDGVDFAVWCHYKYVNAGPGAPGGLFVHEKHFGLTPGLAGWWGHDKGTQFEMRPHFRPAHGAGAYQLGTPSILGLAALEGALEVLGEVGIEAVRARSLQLTHHLMALVDRHLPELTVVTPREAAQRGGHVALAHPDARQLSRALRQRGIIPDYREPDILRLAPVALYNTEEELEGTVMVLRALLDSGEHLRLDQSGGLVT